MPRQRDPTADPPCVWVLAGVLSHRPCDRRYECDSCALFHALRDGPAAWRMGGAAGAGAEEPAGGVHFDAGAQLVATYLAQMVRGCSPDLALVYGPDHWWLDCAGFPVVTAGLEPLALRVLQPVDEIVLPRIGLWLRRGEPCGWIVRGHRAIALGTPVSGEVLDARREPAEARPPETAADDRSWLLRVRAHEDPAATPGHRRGADALAGHLESVRLIEGALRAAVVGNGDPVGTTLADGGEPLHDLEAVLGVSRFGALLDVMFPSRP